MSDKDHAHAWSNGYDYIPAEPNAIPQLDCPVCGQQMAVERGRYGPTGYAEAMARKGRPHDLFTCPNAREQWHAHALELRKEADNTASTKVRELIEQDLAELIQNNRRGGSESGKEEANVNYK